MSLSASAAQLARIAAKRPPAREFKVGIYRLSYEFIDGILAWLCAGCKAKREADGYVVTERLPTPHELPCDDCGVPA